MKKLSFIAILMVFVTLFACGCNNSTNQSESQNSSVESTVEEIPTLEELFEINTYEEILKNHDNFYMKADFFDVSADTQCIQELVFTQGQDGIDYHLNSEYVGYDDYVYTMSRVGNEWYFYSTDEQSLTVPYMLILAFGDDLFQEYRLPDITYGKSIGKGFIDNGQIVYYAADIVEETEDMDASRCDIVYYFNKETKLIERKEEIAYDYRNVVVATYTYEFKYDVDIKECFGEKIRDTVYASENRIDLEIVLDYNTPEQRSYSFVATTNSRLVVIIGRDVYELYVDAEFTNKLETLESLEGQTTATVYAKLREIEE